MLAGVRRFLQILLLVLLIAAGVGGRYLYNRGLTKSWREWVVKEVRKHGVEVSFARLTVRPFRGLVAKDVRFYDSPARNRVIAQMNEMVIEANYANAAKHKPFLDALTLVDTTLQIPLDAQNPFGPALRVDRLNARILFPPDQVQVTRLDAIVSGIRVRANGSFVVPSGLSFTREKSGGDSALAETLVRELGALRYEGALPTLAVTFSGNLGKPGDITVDAQFRGEKIRRGRYALASLVLSAIWQNNTLLLQRLDATDAKGNFQASGNFDPKTRTAELRLRSALDLPAMLRSANVPALAGTVNALADFAFTSSPRLDLTARAEFPARPGESPRVQFLGHAAVGKFQYGGVPIESASADISWDGRRWAVRDFLLQHENGGEISGDAQQDFDAAGTGDFRLGLTSSISPQILLPLLGPAVREKLALAKFHDAPRITLSARGTAPGLDTLSAAGDLKLGHTVIQGADIGSADVTFRHNGGETAGTLKLGRTTFRGIDVSAADLTFRHGAGEISGTLKAGRAIYRGVEARGVEAAARFDGRVLTLDSFEVTRAEGSGKGALSLDTKTGIYTIRDVRTTMHPAEIALWIDLDLVQDVKPYRFGKRPPSLRLDGTLDPRKGGTQTRLTVLADAPGGMDYTFCKKDLHFGSMKGRLFFTDDSLKLTDVRGELFGGTLTANGDISTLKARPGESLTIRIAGAEFSKLSKLYFGFDDSKGKLDGSCTFTGKGGAAASLRGEGELAITEGNVFAIPFLGPISDILNKIVPGMGVSQAHKATATFAMGEGILTNKDLVVQGNGFSMFGGGRIWLTEDKLDYDVRINARGIPGILTFPLSKLFEYRANSRLTKPEWKPTALQGGRQ